MKKIFLTGASAGLGRAMAERLCAAGHEVWGTSRDAGRLPSLGGFHPLVMDLAEYDSVRKAFGTAWREAGQLDVVINNAGGGHFDTAASLSIERFEELFQTLVFAQVELCRLALSAMSESKSGLIINVTSLASRLPVPYMSAYNAAKAAMASYTFSLQLEPRAAEVQIVDLQPADICTSFNDSISPQPADDPKVMKTWAVVKRNMAHAPSPEFVARHVLRLVEGGAVPPRLTVGDLFQSKIAPLIFRLLPQRVRVWGLKRYYGV